MMISNNTSNLAIIIPAYKVEYLGNVLDSLARQTCKNFTVYIGDDNSPHNLWEVVEKYVDQFNLVYKRFENNLGGKDLVAQWNRCIELASIEEWIWLFSDDDVMGDNCIEMFYRSLKSNPNESVFHFNVVVIDEKGKKLLDCIPFPDRMTSEEFFKKRIQFKLTSFVVEYILRRETFFSLGQFDSYDLAWSADDAAWVKFGMKDGIKTVEGAYVNWRLSGLNISSIVDDTAILLRKLEANINYLNWIKLFFIENNVEDTTTEFQKSKWVFQLLKASSKISFNEKIRIAFESLGKLGFKGISLNSKVFTYLFFWEFKRRIS